MTYSYLISYWHYSTHHSTQLLAKNYFITLKWAEIYIIVVQSRAYKRSSLSLPPALMKRIKVYDFLLFALTTT